MTFIILLSLGMICGIVAAHFNFKKNKTKGIKAFFGLCLGGGFLAAVMLFSFLAPIWVSYAFAVACVAIVISNISNYRKSLAG